MILAVENIYMKLIEYTIEKIIYIWRYLRSLDGVEKGHYERMGKMRSCLRHLLSLSIVLLFAAAFCNIGICERAYAGKDDHGKSSGSGMDNSNDGSSHDNGHHDDHSSGHKYKPHKHWYTSGNKYINPEKYFLGTTDARDLAIRTGNVERIRITNEGDVGIGTDTPTGILHVDGGHAAGTIDDGTDITLKAQDGGVVSGAGGNIVLEPGSGIMTDESGNPVLDDEGNPVPDNGEVIVKGNIAPASDDVNSVGTPELRYKDIYLASNIHYQDDGLFFMFDFWNERDEVWVSLERGVFTWDGKFGIGIHEPTEELHVIGDVLATGNIDAASYTGDGSTLSGVVTSEADPTVPANIKDGVSWGEVSGIPADIADGDDTGIAAESDPTVAASVKDGVDWTEVTSIPADLLDGDDGIATESDPTVPENIKDGISWGEVSGIPADIADGDDTGIASESDPQVGENTLNKIPKWDGSALVTGSIFDNGNVGIGDTNPTNALKIVDSANQFTTLQIAAKASGTDHLDGLWIQVNSKANPDVSILNRENGTLRFGTNATDKLVIEADGDVGIGTTSPTEKLTVAGTIESTSGGVKFPDGTTQTTAATSDNNPTSFFEVYLSANQTIPYSFVRLNWALEDSDTNNEFDLANDRFTVKVAGMYMLQAAATITSSQTRESRILLRKNGNIEIAESISSPSHTGAASTNSFSIMVNANVGDYFEVWAREGTDDRRYAYGGKKYTYFKGYRLP